MAGAELRNNPNRQPVTAVERGGTSLARIARRALPVLGIATAGAVLTFTAPPVGIAYWIGWTMVGVSIAYGAISNAAGRVHAEKTQMSLMSEVRRSGYLEGLLDSSRRSGAADAEVVSK